MGEKLVACLQRFQTKETGIKKPNEVQIALYFKNSLYMDEVEFYKYLNLYKCTNMSDNISLVMEFTK